MAEDNLSLDLLASGRLGGLPAALVAGEDTDLLAPLEFARPGVVPRLEPAEGVDRTNLALAMAAANRSYGHPGADRLAGALADPATRVVVTGQQPGLFGGPLYALSKAVAAVRWAEALRESGQPAVAVYWVATEDHDFAEISRATLAFRNDTERFDLGEDPSPLAPAGVRTLGEPVAEVIERIIELGDASQEAWWREVATWYRPDARFGEAFCRLMVRVLGERCPLLLDSMLPDLKAAERPILSRLVEKREEVSQALAQAEANLEERGHTLQVKPQPGTSPLFVLEDGQRRRVEWDGADGYRLRGTEGGGGSAASLEKRIDDNPILVSPGVLARPAVQDAVLGTSLLLLGPGELAYLGQAAALYPVLGVRPPTVALRPQALVVDHRQRRWIEALGVDLELLTGDAAVLRHELAERAGEDLVTPLRQAIETGLGELREKALAVDPNLEKPWTKTRDQTLRALGAFADRLAAARLRADETSSRRIERLRSRLVPGGKPAERVLAIADYQARFGDELAQALYQQMDLDPRHLSVVLV